MMGPTISSADWGRNPRREASAAHRRVMRNSMGMTHPPLTDPKFKTTARVVAGEFGPAFQKAYASFAWWGITSGALKSSRSEVVQDPPGLPERQCTTFRKLHKRALINALTTAIASTPKSKAEDPRLRALRAGIVDAALCESVSDAEVAAYMAYVAFLDRILYLAGTSKRIRDDRRAERLWNNWHRLHNTMLLRKLEQAARLGGLVVGTCGKGWRTGSVLALPRELLNEGR